MPNKTIIVRAGKVPGIVHTLPVNEGATLKQVMNAAATMGGFTFSTEPYPGPEGKTLLDVPFVNGKAAAKVLANGSVERVYWDQVVEANQVILLIPRIKGNQITVHVGREGGAFTEIGLLSADDPEAADDDGTVEQALKVVKMELGEDEYPTINGEEVYGDTAVDNGDVIIIKKRDLMPILFGDLNEQIETRKIERGTTLAKFIDDEFGCDLRDDESAILNGRTVGPNADFDDITLKENDSLILVTMITTTSKHIEVPLAFEAPSDSGC